MDLQEATIAMASFMKGEALFYREHLENPLPRTVDEVERYAKAKKEFEWLQSNTREFGNVLAADPNFFDIMESWKVVIKGTDGVNPDSIKSALETNDVDDLVERCGSIASGIKDYIKSKGWMVCDMSAGEDGWDIAVRCSEKNSRLLCEDMYHRYHNAPQKKLITISRRFAGHCLPGVYSWEDAERILKAIYL